MNKDAILASNYGGNDITIVLDNKDVGRLYLKDEKLAFEGDADESALVFIDTLKGLWAVPALPNSKP